MANLRSHKALLAAAAILLPMLLASPAGATVAQRDVLIKGPGTGATVYYLANDGKRYVFPNQKTYQTWFSDFSGVMTVSLDDLISFPLGGNVTYRPGIRLVKITTDPKVYAVDWNGTLRWIKTEGIAAALYGSNWSTKVDDVPDAFFVNYQLGADIGATSQYSPFTAASMAPTINANRGISASSSPRQANTAPDAPGAPPSSTATPPPSSSGCTADVWVCSEWSACSSSGTQTRSCSLSSQCSAVASSTPPQSQSCTPSVTTTIGVSVDTEAGDVAGGTDAVLAKFRMSASNEDLRLSKASFHVQDPAAAISLRLYDGDTAVSSSASVDGNGDVFFTDVNFVIPRNTAKDLIVHGLLNAVGPSGVPSGTNAKVTFKNTSGQYVFEMVGASLGSNTRITSIPGGQKTGNDKILRKTVPTVSVVALPSTVLTSGTVIAARVTVAAGPNDMSLRALTVDIDKPNHASVAGSGDATHSTIREYGQGENIAGHSTASGGCGASSGTFCRIRTEFATERQIAAGDTKTFDVRLVIGGTLAKGDTLATTLDGDSDLLSGALTAGSSGDQVRVAGSDVDFAWSDLSSVPHKYDVPGSSSDWASGAFVTGLPTDTQVLVK